MGGWGISFHCKIVVFLLELAGDFFLPAIADYRAGRRNSNQLPSQGENSAFQSHRREGWS